MLQRDDQARSPRILVVVVERHGNPSAGSSSLISAFRSRTALLPPQRRDLGAYRKFVLPFDDLTRDYRCLAANALLWPGVQWSGSSSRHGPFAVSRRGSTLMGRFH